MQAEYLQGASKHAKETSNDCTFPGRPRLYSKSGRYHGTLWREYLLCECGYGEKSSCGARCRYWYPGFRESLAGASRDYFCAPVPLALGSYPGLSIF